MSIQKSISCLLLITAPFGMVTACGEPTQVSPPDALVSTQRRDRIAEPPLESEFGCMMNIATPGSAAFHIKQIKLYFPLDVLSPTHATRHFTYRGYANGSRLTRLVVCEVPATRAAITLAFLRLGITGDVPFSTRGRSPDDGIGTLEAGDTETLPTLEVTACQYGGEYPECNPAPIDPYDFLNDCTLYGVCGTAGTWYWGPGGGGGGADGGTFENSGPFLSAVTCILGFAVTGYSMLQVADVFGDVILTGRQAGEAERTYNMYVQQSSIDVTMQIHLEDQMNDKKQAYRDAITALSSAMNTSFLTAAGSVLACGATFALPTP